MAILKPIELATEIVTAFVSNNSLPRGELAALLESVHAAVQRLAAGAEVAPVVTEALTPAVSIRKSVTPEYLICLDDGKRFKSLRRHLATLGMTPEQYREKWDLPSTYPMVAPNYAAQRSALAKAAGLGQLREKTADAAPPSTVEGPAPEPASVDEVVAAPAAKVTAAEAVAPEPPIVAKGKAKPKTKAAEAPPEAPVKRKPGRPRKATT